MPDATEPGSKKLKKSKTPFLPGSLVDEVTMRDLGADGIDPDDVRGQGISDVSGRSRTNHTDDSR